MNLVIDAYNELLDFLNTGGFVLYIILYTSIILWFLIIERFLFFKMSYPSLRRHYIEQWRQRKDKHSSYARYFRTALVSEALTEMQKTLPVIKVLTHLCPMLGLLGTVTGMIHVFDVMAITGNGNARAMASGISQATISTMAGMVIAITGLYFNRLLEQRIDDETHHLADALQNH